MDIVGAENDKQKTLIEAAVKMWGFLPYRRCWIAEKEGEQGFFILKATAHAANKYARAGYAVRELHKELNLNKLAKAVSEETK